MMKGGHGGGGGGRRGWNVYFLTVVILLVVFGVTILGLMGIQRMRERNVFNRLIKEKEDQILSLQHLLQKEREHVQEDKRRFHEMKMKIYSLRAQKTELNKRLLEMESTLSSLKEEQKIIESAFEEKQNEAKLFRERYILIKDQIQQKEAEIEDLKHHLQFPGKEYTSGSENKHESGENSRDGVGSIRNDDVSRYRETESSTKTEERGNERLDEKRGEMIRKEQFAKLENSQERNVENGRTDPQNGESFDKGKKKKNEYETEMNDDVGNEAREAHFGDGRRLEIEHDTQSKRSSNSEVSVEREFGVHRSGVKLELQENSHSGSNGYIGNHNHQNRAKGNRWRAISEEIEGKWNTKSNGAATTRGQRFSKGTLQVSNRFDEEKPTIKAKIKDLSIGLNNIQNESVSKKQHFGVDDKITDTKQRNVKTKSSGYTKENTGENIEDSPPGIKLQNSRKLTDTDEMSQNVAKAEVGMSRQVEKAREGILKNSSSTKSLVSLNDVPNNISGSSNQGTVSDLEKYKQSKEQGFIIGQHTGNKNDDSPGQTKVFEKNEDPDDIEMWDFEDTELGTSNPKETVSRVEIDSEED